MITVKYLKRIALSSISIIVLYFGSQLLNWNFKNIILIISFASLFLIIFTSDRPFLGGYNIGQAGIFRQSVYYDLDKSTLNGPSISNNTETTSPMAILLTFFLPFYALSFYFLFLA